MDPLEQYWDEDREEWRYRKAVRENHKVRSFLSDNLDYESQLWSIVLHFSLVNLKLFCGGNHEFVFENGNLSCFHVLERCSELIEASVSIFDTHRTKWTK